MADVTHAEWWAHTREEGGPGHQLHLDVNETHLRKVGSLIVASQARTGFLFSSTGTHLWGFTLRSDFDVNKMHLWSNHTGVKCAQPGPESAVRKYVC